MTTTHWLLLLWLTSAIAFALGWYLRPRVRPEQPVYASDEPVVRPFIVADTIISTVAVKDQASGLRRRLGGDLVTEIRRKFQEAEKEN